MFRQKLRIVCVLLSGKKPSFFQKVTLNYLVIILINKTLGFDCQMINVTHD